MPKVNFLHPDGRREVHDAPVGDSIMDCALDNGVEGIGGRCGGACNCSTCHCWIEPAWFERLPERSTGEIEILSYLAALRDNSRLGCQIELSESLDGIVVRIPPVAG